MIPIANRVAFENAPPESVFRYATMFVLASVRSLLGRITSASTFVSRNGTGMTEPILNTTIIISVNKIFFLRSGIDHAFLITLNNLDHLCLSARSLDSGLS